MTHKSALKVFFAPTIYIIRYRRRIPTDEAVSYDCRLTREIAVLH